MKKKLYHQLAFVLAALSVILALGYSSGVKEERFLSQLPQSCWQAY